MASQYDLNEVKRWLLKKIIGNITDIEQDLLQRWIEADPHNKAFAEHILSRSFLESAILDKNEAILEKSWKKLHFKISYVRFGWTTVRKCLIVATLIGLLTGIYFYFQAQENIIYAGTSKAFFCAVDTTYLLKGEILNYTQYIFQKNKSSNNQISPMSQNTIVVPRGGEYKILLEDSTVIHLGPESSLSVPYNFSKTNRTVKISGEAYLIVHGDSLYPFNIEMPRINIRVRGTELNIEAYENETDTHVVLVKGKAEVVSLTKEPVELSVGYTTIVSRGDSIRKVPANIPECTAWHHSRLSFEGKSLEFIMTKLERWYNVKAIFKDDLSRNLCITMNVDKYDTFNNLANSIRKMNELQIEIKKGNTVYVSANNYKSQ